MTATETEKTTKPRRYLTPVEVAEELEVTPETVRNWIERGITVYGRRVCLKDLGARKHGWFWRIPREALAEFLRLCNQGEGVELERDRKEQEAEAAAAGKRVRKRLGLEP